MKYILLIFTLIPILLQAQPLYEKQIIPFDGLQNDYFGTAIAKSDSFLFISSLRYRNHNENAVYIYRLKNNDYTFEYKIHPSEPQTGILGELFGSRLVYKDGQLFVGAPNKKVNNIFVGVVYVFEYENYLWIEKQIILPPIPHTFNGSFSTSIVKSNEYLLIGAPYFNYGEYKSGKAFLYKRINGKYELQEEFTPFDTKDDQGYGGSLDMNENLIIIGSSNDSTESGKYSGSIYVYIKEDSLWKFSRKYLPEFNSTNLAYGCAIESNNDYIFVGTSDNIYYNSSGKVYIYKYSETSLDLTQIIESGDNYFNDRFGISLFTKGDSLLVSAIFDTVKNDNPGSAYLFVNEEGVWNKKYKLYPLDEVNTSWFAGRCILIDDKIFVGARQTRVNGIRTGSVFIYSSEPLSVVDENTYDINNFYLSQNFPNPFNSSTRIEFYIPKAGRVRIKIYDITGKELKTILNEEKESNNYFLNIDFREYPSGIYFYRIEYFYEENNEFKRSFIIKKAVLIK